MGKKIYLSIIYSITAICIVAGIIINVWSVPSLSWKNGFIRGRNYITINDTLDSFYNLDIDVSVANINISTGDSFAISYKGSQAYRPEYYIYDNTLKVNQSANNGHITNALRNSKSELTITVPADTSLTNISCNINAGNCDLSDIKGSDITIHADMGNLGLALCSFNDYNLNVNMGNVDVSQCSFDNMYLNTDMGNISVNLPHSVTCAYKLDTDLGNINVYGTNHKNSFSDNLTADKVVTAKTSMGNVNINN